MQSSSAINEPTILLAKPGAESQLTGPRLRTAQFLWLIAAFIAVGMFIAGTPLTLNFYTRVICLPHSTVLAALHLSTQVCSAAYFALDVGFGLVFAIVSAIIFWRKPGERVAILGGFALLLFGFSTTTPLSFLIVQPGWQQITELVVALGIALFAIFFFVFPDGRFIPNWTRFLTVGWLGWAITWAVFPTLSPFSLPSPFNDLTIALCNLPSVLVQVYRYRSWSSPTQKQQTKWVVFGGTAALVLYFGSVLPWAESIKSPGLSLIVDYFISVIHYGSLMIIPLVIGISIFRFRLWDIDLVINRALVYGALTASLVIVFVGGVFLIQNGAAVITGGQQSNLAIALSVVVIALLFQPVRTRLQTVIDRRFYPKYLDNALRLHSQNRVPVLNPGLLTGKHLGVYEVLEPIGRGGMAEIYKGRHQTLDRTVAIKTLTASHANAETFRNRFEREARMVALLRHTNIVQLFDFGETDGIYYMVMEYIAGQDLGHYLQNSGALSLAEARPIIAAIADALDYAHSQGIVHRDVKPTNIMLQPVTAEPSSILNYRPILMDFGIAKLLESDSGLTHTGTLGTLDYIAPEQIISSSTVDGRADIYALGIMSYQILTGQLPFYGNNPAALILAHLQRQAPDPRKIMPSLSAGAAYAILRALAKEPSERFATAGNLVIALSE